MHDDIRFYILCVPITYNGIQGIYIYIIGREMSARYGVDEIH
jgi:hypothetical protein